MATSKIVVGLGILTGVVAAGLAIGWLATRGTVSQLPPEPIVPPSTDHSNSVPRTNLWVPPVSPRHIARNHSEQSGAISNTTPEITASNTSTNWEDRLDEILSSESEDTNKVQELFALFPTLPPDGQEEVAQHLANLTEDENYAPLGKLLLDAKLPEDVLEVLLADLLNRPNDAKLPMFLELAKNPAHPKAEEAKDLLELYLDEDYGTDWGKWESAMKKWIAENPD